MKCLQCGADLLDSATFCARCGTPIRATSFSYLPTGAPPWPATVPQNILRVAVKQPAQATATTLVTSAAASKPRRSVGRIFATMFLLLVSIAIGVGGTFGSLAMNGQLARTSSVPANAGHLVTPVPTTATGTASPAATTTPQTNLLPTPTAFLVVKNADVGISLRYPADWVQDQPQKSAYFIGIAFHPHQAIGINLVIQRFSSTGSAQFKSTDDASQSILQQDYQNGSMFHNYQQIQPANSTPTIGGVQWIERDATFADTNNVVLHAVSISVQHNKLYYNISYYALSTLYDEAMQKYYSQILASFQFLS